ncbi:MAG: hypothetical protein ACXAD7_15620 [Candidatus Kariarchaeaceae archaeon]
METIEPLLVTLNIGVNFGKLKQKIEYNDPNDEYRKKIKLHELINDLTAIYKGIELLGLHSNLNKDIEEYLNQLYDKYGEMKEKKDTPEMMLSRFKSKLSQAKYQRITLNKEESKYLNKKILLWSDRIHHDLSGLQTVQIKSELNIDKSKLLYGPQEFLPDVWERLNETTKLDLQQCVNCLLIGAWVPSALGILKILNTSTRYYYSQFTDDADEPSPPIDEILDYIMANSKADLLLIEDIRSLKNTLHILVNSDSTFQTSDAEQAFLKIIKILDMIY